MPWLIREAGDVCRDVVRRSLADAGCGDVPRNGAFVLTGLDPSERDLAFSPQADVVASLGLSKQAASQLIDTLVVRDYLERRIDPEDRRRMEVRLTERGRRAVRAIEAAIRDINTTLAGLITADELHGLKAGLAAFREVRDRAL